MKDYLKPEIAGLVGDLMPSKEKPRPPKRPVSFSGEGKLRLGAAHAPKRRQPNWPKPNYVNCFTPRLS
jgi:hypothetical protein